MALPPTQTGAGAPPAADDADLPGQTPGEEAAESPEAEAQEEHVVVLITEHDGPDGKQFSVYDHLPQGGEGGAGDGAIVSTAEVGEALAAAYKVLKPKGDGQANADMMAGYGGDEGEGAAAGGPGGGPPSGKGMMGGM